MCWLPAAGVVRRSRFRALSAFLVLTVTSLGAGTAVRAEDGGVSAEQLAQANNPLADANALNLHNYALSGLRGVTDEPANTLLLRPVVVAGRHIVRATLPVLNLPTGADSYTSGLGDLTIFDAIVLTGQGATTMHGVGPLAVFPTASDDALGAGKWQLGAAGVVVHPLTGGSMLAGLVTWQTDIGGDADRTDTNLLTAQPIAILQLGSGFYVRSSGVWTFDIENERHLIPFGLGAGKVFRVGSTVVNAFLEPQFSVYAEGDGQPTAQVFAGLNLQWFR
jgi:hypothetical protein